MSEHSNASPLLRFVSLASARGDVLRPPKTRCSRAGCRAATRGGKPVCRKHVLEMPYAKDLLRRLAEQEEEDARVLRYAERVKRYAPRVDPRSITAHDIMAHLLAVGSATAPGLARALHRPLPVIKAYLRGLRSLRMIREERTTRRGYTVVTLTRAGEDAFTEAA